MNTLIGTSPLGLAMIKHNHATTDQEAKEIKALTATVKEQASQIQKVSDKVELNKPAPQMVGNNEKGPPDLQNY